MDPIVEPGQWRIPEWFPNLTSQQLERLRFYHSELLRFNKKINLISVKTELRADEIHFADSISGGGEILAATDAPTIHDIGTGAGFPGLVMAIINPDRQFILLDNDIRKIEFIKYLVQILEIKNVKASAVRVQDLSRDEIRVGVCRAFASLAKALLITRKSFCVGGTLFLLKGEGWTTELAQVPTQLCMVWTPGLLKEYPLPSYRGRYAVLFARKTRDG